MLRFARKRPRLRPEIWLALPAEAVNFNNIVSDPGFASLGPTGNATTPTSQFNTGQYLVTGGQGRHTNGAALQSYLSFDIPVAAGRTYDLSLDMIAGTSGAALGHYFTQSDGTTNVAEGAGAGTKSATAVATGGFWRFTTTTGTATSGHTAFFDNMSVKLNDAATRNLVYAHCKSLGITGIRTDFRGTFIFAGSAASRNWTEPDDIAARCYANGLKLSFTDAGTASWAAATSLTYPTTQLTNWCTAFTEAAARYRGVCGTWEIRNEQNIGFSQNVINGDNATVAASAYMTYATAMAAAIRAGNPDAKVISHGISPTPTGGTVLGSHIAATEYLTAMYVAGAKGVFDGIGFHPYARPEQPDAGTSWNGWTIMDKEIRAIMGLNGEGAKPIWATEFGYPTGGTSSGEQTSRADAASGIRKAAWMARGLRNVPVIALHTIMDYLGSQSGSANNEHYYGLIDVSNVEKAEITAAVRYATGVMR